MKPTLMFLTALLLAPLAALHAAESAKPPTVTDVWVVFKTHFDLGFTDLAENVFEKYRVAMMDGALKVIEQNRDQPPEKRFVWTVPGWPLARVILGPQQDPQRKERIEHAIREGSLAVHALPFTMHTESLDLEDLVRGLHYSAQLCRDYGRSLPIAAKMTDVPSHSWVMPTLLANGGIRFLHLGCNAASQYPRVPPLFWWEGPDGSRILCAYATNYGSGIIPPQNWPARNYLAMITNGDNHGPPTPAEVEKFRQQAELTLPGIRIHFGTLDNFVNAIDAEKPELPVVRGDTPDTWIHGVMSMPTATKIARNIRPLEPVLDSLDTHLKIYGLATTTLAPALAEAYENSLLYGEHTWGSTWREGPSRLFGEAWKQWVANAARETDPTSGKRKWLKTFDDHRAYIGRADEIVQRELNMRLQLLAENVNGKGRRVVVWNGLPWARSGLVEVPGQSGRFIYADNVPPSGYRTFSLPEKADAETAERSARNTLDTTFYHVTFDQQRGGLASLVEKKTGREMVDAASPYVLGQFLHERFSTNEVMNRFFKNYSRIQGSWAYQAMAKPRMPGPDQSPYCTLSPSGWTLSVRHTDLSDTATLTSTDTKGLAKGCVLKFTFPSHAPYVDVEWTVTEKTGNPIPEGGWLCFPFAIANPRFTLGRLGGPIAPEEIIPGANRHLYAVATGVSIAGAGQVGVSLCPLDSPLISLDQPGLWWWTLDFLPKKPTVFVNLYNNEWNTNFPLWQDGSWSERVRLWPTAELLVPSWEARVPLLAALATKPGGKLPAEQAGLSVSRPGVLVTAFGNNPDGAGTLLRVWDQTGATGEIAVNLPSCFKAAVPVDLRGEKTGPPIVITKASLKFTLKPFAPASFLLE